MGALFSGGFMVGAVSYTDTGDRSGTDAGRGVYWIIFPVFIIGIYGHFRNVILNKETFLAQCFLGHRSKRFFAIKTIWLGKYCESFGNWIVFGGVGTLLALP